MKISRSDFCLGGGVVLQIKKQYEEPIIDIIYFDNFDCIVTSTTNAGEDDDNENDWGNINWF